MAKLAEQGTKVDKVHFEWNRDMGTDYSAIFAGEQRRISAVQSTGQLEGDVTDPKLLAKIAKALNAPGITYVLDTQKDDIEVRSTINPEELRQANGDLNKLTVAANSKVSQAELTAAAASDDLGDKMNWKATTELPKALNAALEQAKNATANLQTKLGVDAATGYDGGQNVADRRTPDSQLAPFS